MNKELVDNLSTSRRRVGHTAFKEKKMKTYEVEMRRTSFVTITVEAKDMEEAEFIAYQELVDTNEAAWTVESIEEVGK